MSVYIGDAPVSTLELARAFGVRVDDWIVERQDPREPFLCSWEDDGGQVLQDREAA